MFDARKLSDLLSRGIEAVRFTRGLQKNAVDSFVADKMRELVPVMGHETWETESIRRWRGKTKRRTSVSAAILNKFVYVCLTEAGEILKAKWAVDVFAANDMEREEMFPMLLELLDKFEEKQDLVQSRGGRIVTPLQRPPRPVHFVGRGPELKRILNYLEPGRGVTIWGPGGIGKSALAAEVVWHLTAHDRPPTQFPDGIIYYNFYNQPETALAFEHIAVSFQTEPRPTPRSAAHRVLSEHRPLLVLDGVEVADNLADLLSIGTGCGVLMTTRNKLDSAGLDIELSTLPLQEAVSLLQKLVRISVEMQVASRICEGVGGLPLAVMLAGRYLAATQETAANYLTWLDQSPLAALHHGERQHQSVPVLLHKSLEQVGGQARQIFAVVSALAPTSFAIEPVAIALEKPLTEIRAALNELLLFGLLKRVNHRYQVGHLLIYMYAQRHFRPSIGIFRKLVEYFANLGQAQSGQGVVGFELLNLERRHGIQLLAECRERQQWQAAQQLTNAFDGYLDLQGYWTDRVTALETALAAAQALSDLQAEARFMSLLGNVYLKWGQFSQAHQFMQNAVDLANQSGDYNSYLICLFDQGNLRYEIDEPAVVVEHYQLVLSLLQGPYKERLMGSCLGHIGLAYQKWGKTELAIEHLEQGLAVARKFDDLTSQNRYLGGLGLAYLDAGDPQKAIEYHTQALAMARTLGDRYAEGMDLGNLGIALFYANESEAALQRLQQALELARQIGDEVNQGRWLVHLGEVYSTLGGNAQAAAYYGEALPLFERFSPAEAEQVQIRLAEIYRPHGTEQ